MFLREVVGTDGHFTVDEISDQLRNIIVVALRHDRRGLGHPGARPRRQLRPAGPVRARPDRTGVRQLRPRARHDPGRERVAAARGRAGAGSAHLDGRGGRSRQVHPVPGRRGDAGRGRQPGCGRPGDRDDGGHGRRASRRARGGRARPSRPAPPPPTATRRRRRPIMSRSTARPPGRSALEQLREQVAERRADPRPRWSGRRAWPAGSRPARWPSSRPCSPRSRRRFPALPEPMPAGPWGGLRTEEDRAGARRRQGLLAAAAPVHLRAMRRHPQLCAGHDRAGLQLLRPPQPHRREPGRDRRAAARPGPARGWRRGAAEPAEIPAKCASCGADFALQAAGLRRPLPVLRPAGGGRPGPVPQDPADRRPAVPDRRPGGAPAGRRLAQGTVVRAFGHRRAGARARAGCTASTCPTGPSTAAPAPAMSAGAATSTTRPSMSTPWSTAAGCARRCRCPRSAGARPRARSARDFDDVLVLAGETLPPHLVEALEPWDLDGMRPFTPDYLERLRRRALPAPGRRRASSAARRSCAR